MVKIIKSEPDNSVVKRIICKHCGSTLEYVPNDIKKRNEISNGCLEGCKYIVCANCKKVIILNVW